MSDLRKRRIEELARKAAELAAGERSAFFSAACEGDDDLRREAEALLDSGSVPGDKAIPSTIGLGTAAGAAPVTGDRVFGPYSLLQLIGQGGMGEVWLAEQKQPVRRRVAVKLIKAGMDTQEVVARFESERQALALMDHPAIAKVFDGGSTQQGRPYFVMEYVSGQSITEYCDRHKLTTRQRLELFIEVCDGVQYAHQKAIIHRDIKPSNILVTEVDGKPKPRIIDFGVAKATAQGLTANALHTRVGAVVGTPGYMSPEQADSAGRDVDTRTDIYSLGVLLYELLVGALPVDLTAVPLDQIASRLRDGEVARPSTKVSGLKEKSGVTASNRGSDPADLKRELRGDLDAIALKALEFDRSRRYSAPSEMAADIRRHLRHEPVLARPASTAYRVRKYVRRHRVGVALASAVAILVVSFSVFQTFQLRRITRERDRADRVTRFMTEMFKVSDPGAARGNSITAREVLDRASREVGSGLAKDPELQAQMMQVMGDVYSSLGLYPPAEALLTQAVSLRRRFFGSQAAETLESMHALGWVVQAQGRLGEAEKLLREALDKGRHVLGADDRFVLQTMNALAATLYQKGQPDEAKNLQRESLERSRRALGPDDPLTAVAASNLANMLYFEGRLADAEALQREALESRRRIRGPDHPSTLASMVNLAEILNDERRYAEAETLTRECLEVQRKVLGPEHPVRLMSMNNLAEILLAEGRTAEAEKEQREAFELEVRVLGPEHPQTLEAMGTRAKILVAEGRSAEAEKVQREVVALRRRVLGPEHPQTEASTYRLGVIELTLGKRDAALSLLRQAVERGFPAGMENDPALKALEGDPRYEALVAHAKERAAAGK